MTEPQADAEHLAALIDLKLADAERRAAEGEIPEPSELNGLRRLVDWAESERELAQARELTTR